MFTDKERLLLRLAILTRQLGNTSGTLSFYLRTALDEQEKRNALFSHLKCDVSDLLIQVLDLIKALGLNRWEIEQMGLDRQQECKNEFDSSGRSSFFI